MATRSVFVVGTIGLVLLIIGGLNWGLVGLFNFDLVAAILGDMTMPARAVYVLVGVAAIVGMILFRRLVYTDRSTV